ncbi:hypothetical protein [Nonomuraea sp. NPDC048901]|uniref:hypothetical protein n=1 Tax=Nonomuraea sp. NPDC048901 TaxID=3155627 RepID=UPI0033F5FCE3
MSLFILALILAAVICGVMWRRPDARAVAAGAWQAGKAQAIREFRDGYDFAQHRLRAGDPSWKNPRRWTSWLLAGLYGIAKALTAANRIRRAAWLGARDRYAEWKAAQPIDGEVIDETDAETDEPAPDPDPQPDQPDPEQSDEPDSSEDPPNTEPDQGPETDQEEPPVQTEAAGLTSYSAAHQQFASELRAQMSGSESLAASMADILAKHSDLIGDTAVLQDLLNQAAGVAQGIADRALAVANN